MSEEMIEELNEDVENKKEKKKLRKGREEKLAEEIIRLEESIKELNNRILYNQAEFANYKKRKDQETSNMLKYSNSDIVTEMLPIVDNFERAVKLDDTNLTDELSKFLEGFKMIYSHLTEVFKKFEVREIECLNKEFDPNFQQSLMTGVKEGVAPGIVIEVFQKGYMLKDKMLRPALVRVSEENKENNNN